MVRIHNGIGFYSGDTAIYFPFGSSIRAFEVIVISVAKFLVPCFVSEIFKRQMILAIRYLVLKLGLLRSFTSDYEYDYEYEIRHFCAKPTPYACATSYSREKVVAVAHLSTKICRKLVVLTTTF